MGILAKARAIASPEQITVAEWREGDKFRSIKETGRVRVSAGEELRRVANLPRRAPLDLSSPRAAAMIQLMNERLRRPDWERVCACRGELHRPFCLTSLRASQAWALYEFGLMGGGLGAIGVGDGKTGIGILAPLVLPECKIAVLFIPSGNREQFWREFLAWREHFQVPSVVMGEKGIWIKGRPTLHVIAYSVFSREGATALLDDLKPDYFLNDEAHNFRNRESVRTGRYLRYNETRDAGSCSWSGTLTNDSIKDFSHLSALALGEHSPTPIPPEIADEWAAAIDPSDNPADGGALEAALCDEGESLQSGMHRRLAETCGVVITTSGENVTAKLVIKTRTPPEMSHDLSMQIENVRETGERPDGETLVDAFALARCLREMEAGFFYRWIFPHGEPIELIEGWKGARKGFSIELRDELKTPRKHLDSPKLLSRAAHRAIQMPLYDGDLPVWHSHCYADWIAIKDQVYHETKAVWVDEFLARDAAAWATEHRGIVWYSHDAFGRLVGKLSGCPVFAGGVGDYERLMLERGERSVIVSMQSHGTGRDGLQWTFTKQLIANAISNATKMEQVLGRLHRPQHCGPRVETWVYRHGPAYQDALAKTISQARYIQALMGSKQKILSAECDFPLQ